MILSIPRDGVSYHEKLIRRDSLGKFLFGLDA